MSTAVELYNEADKLKDEGKFDEAIAKLNEALEQDENYVVAHLALAVIYGRIGQHEEAVKHGQKACEIEPTDPFNFTAMSVTYQRAFAGTQNQQYITLAEDAMAKAHMLQQGGGGPT
jgi:tetratricopeptide (TPR) repeat protein